LERQDLTGTQAVQQHQTDYGKTAESAKAGAELSNLLCSQGLDNAPRLPEAESEGHSTMGAAIAERAARHHLRWKWEWPEGIACP
jgi:hypothetical protein